MANAGIHGLLKLIETVSKRLSLLEGYYCWRRGPDGKTPSQFEASKEWLLTRKDIEELAYQATARGWGAESVLLADAYTELDYLRDDPPAIPAWNVGDRLPLNPTLAKAISRAHFGVLLIATRGFDSDPTEGVWLTEFRKERGRPTENADRDRMILELRAEGLKYAVIEDTVRQAGHHVTVSAIKSVIRRNRQGSKGSK